ncbi:hypothetical protein C2G38_2038930 [Gigaspora rosea]|uniref:FAD-dependent oxidoreductase 2 FAD-binding domain-containing protein n=1 Tax=Gigaspora rosea TaxID=44941 RepID=A0A397V9Q0_9GLOM|nr:hypothetical protein C2G38_2038930 [Gigaspora rosea]
MDSDGFDEKRLYITILKSLKKQRSQTLDYQKSTVNEILAYIESQCLVKQEYKCYKKLALAEEISLAKEIGISASQLKATFDDHNDIASNKKKDPFDKKFFHNFPITINDQFHVALISSILHYIMSEIDINAVSEVRDMQEQVIPGLFEEFQT